jgi:hypothetical protein
MSTLEWCQWLQGTSLATAISESDWLFPIIEGSHILSLPVSVGMILMFDLRLLGLAFTEGPAAKLFPELLRWSKIGFAWMFLSGSILFLTQAGKAYQNAFFRTKMILLVVLGLNAAFYQLRFYPKMPQWEAGRTPIGAKVCAILSLVVWIAVIVCGRTMAYEL